MRRTAMIAAALAAGQLAGAASGCAMRDEPGRAVALAGPTDLRAGRTTVPIRIERKLAATAAGRPVLVIEGFRFDAPPGVLYEVYLQARTGRRALLGVINFYNQGAGAYGGFDAASEPSSTHRFDATAALRAVGGGPTALVFEPTAGVAGPGIRAVVNPAAHVRFRSATLELR
jgi:hypothetical protein